VSRPWQTNRSCKCVPGTARRTIRPPLTHGGRTVAAPPSRDSLPQNVCVVSPSQMRFPNPRRANARRSCSSVSSSPNSARFSPDRARFIDPRRADARRSWRNCVCVSQKSQFPTNARATRYQSGGRKPPVLRQRLCSGNAKSPAGVHSCNTGAGGRKPPVECAPQANSQPGNSTHCSSRCGLLPTCDPRRANARRSCGRACVHRRWCYMQRISVVHPGAVGVSRPWQTNRSCKCVVGTARRTYDQP
jgi:hypothetical protein